MELFFIALGYVLALFKNRNKLYRKEQFENSGERLVRKKLKSFCLKEGAHLLNNVTLKLDDGTTTQIDHIVICTQGVLVVETKDYSGWIYGKGHEAKWTQVHHKLKTRFQNPIRQNYRHIKAVQELMDFLPPESIQGVIVFTNRSEFRTRRPKGVLYEDEIGTYLADFSVHELSLNRVQFCVGRLEYKRMELSKETDIEHVENLRNRFG